MSACLISSELGLGLSRAFEDRSTHSHRVPPAVQRSKPQTTMVQGSTSIVTVSPSPRFKDGLRLVIKRYVAEDTNLDGVTILFFHCTGSREFLVTSYTPSCGLTWPIDKEVFEPMIPSLLSLRHPSEGTAVVREIWAIENPSHGEASVYNEEALKRQDTGFSMSLPLSSQAHRDHSNSDKALTMQPWRSGAIASRNSTRRALSVATLSSQSRTPMAQRPCMSRRVCQLLTDVNLMHATSLLATMPGVLPAVPFKSLILVEPPLITKAAWDEHKEQQEFALKTISAMVMKRRDTWASREDARQYFEDRVPWSSWDGRVLELFLVRVSS